MTTPRPRSEQAAVPARQRAKLFTNGRSQAVRLPKAFRMPGTEVLVSRDGDRIVLEPLDARGWPEGYFESFGPVGSDFAASERLPASKARDRWLEDL